MKVYDLSLWWLIILYMHLQNNIGGSTPEQRWEIALASHQFGACSSPRGGNTWGLSLLVTFALVSRGEIFSTHTHPHQVFFLLKKHIFKFQFHAEGKKKTHFLFVLQPPKHYLFLQTNTALNKQRNDHWVWTLNLESHSQTSHQLRDIPIIVHWKWRKILWENFKDGLQPLVSKYRMTQEIHLI